MEPELDVTLEGPARLPVASGKLELGQQIGHFKIERPLGAGGMGEVYLANDLALDRPVAIKVLPPGLARDANRRDRLIREARAQARIVHSNVAHIYFVGEEAGRLYFAMEYVPGQSLAERIADKPLSIDEALAVVRAAALGLREAQRSGFTHRDVKPSNLMLDAHGHVKVVDFGLVAGAADASEGPVEQTSLAGTPLYMAPEQARGEPVDFRTDIYALGATLYHLIAGAPPFRSDSLEELQSLHETAVRPTLPRRGQPRVIASIEVLCAKMMAPVAADRFASYDELLRAIDLVSPAHTRPAGFWARAASSAIDFALVAFITAQAIRLIGWLLLDRDIEVNVIATDLPAYALYQTLTIGRWGRTAGQRALELDVIDASTGERPGFARAFVRAVVMCAIPSLLEWVGVAVGGEAGNLLVGLSLLSVVGLGGLLLLAALRTPGKRAPWDRVSGTMVRYRAMTAPTAR